MDRFMALQFLLLALLCRARCNLDTFTCELAVHMKLGVIPDWATQPMRMLC